VLQGIPINPGSPKDMLRSLRKAAEELKQDELVCIFPEGGLTRTGHVQAFQRGVERLMQYAPDAPVIPIYLDGLWRHPLSASGQRSLKSFVSAWRREVRIVIGKPVTGAVSTAELRLRILELGTEAANLRKKRDSTLAHALVRSARRNWFRPAIADSSKKRLKYGQALTAAILIRNWLDANHAPERNIGILLPASVAGAMANFGVTLSAKAAVNLNFTAGEPACRAAMSKCAIKTVITSKVFLAKVGLPVWPEMIYLEDLLPGFSRIMRFRALLSARFTPCRRIAGRISADSTACILFSSGSTGMPKGIELTHWNIFANIESAASVYPMNLQDCLLGALPFFHSFGYTFALWFPIVQQFRAVFHANPTDATTIGDLAQSHRATFFLSTPTFCGHYIRKCTPEQFSSLRFVMVGAEKLRDNLAEEFRNKFGLSLLAGYGATELGPCAAANTLDAPNGEGIQPGIRAGSVGRTMPGVSVRVVHPETFTPLPHGQQGLLLINSPSRMAGYHDEPSKTGQVLHDGFYITGDLAYLDEDGFVFITDRLSRFSKIGGEMVPHLKIEEGANGVLADSSCFVTGVPDERRGERLIMLYTRPDVTPAQIVEHLKAALPPLWVPKREDVHLVDAIPVLGTGKLDLAQARALASAKMQSHGTVEVTAQA
jgi:acyl-[acyl-carrier-protein]-phospholipid O-acyltransferase/long-chain-fatty-acid--[acyl-carrier-protein] ligase